MKRKYKKQIYSASGIIVIVLLSLILTYATNFSDPFSRFFKNFYPAVIAGNGLISIGYWNEGHVLAQKLDPKISFEKISAQLVKAKEEQQLLWSLKAFYDSPTLTEELKFYKTDNDQEYKDLIDKYFNSDNKLFSEFVIKPEVTDALLRIKYNSDFYANQDAYNRAQDILNKIKSGQSFEDLAKTSSDDKVSGQLGGDLGFVASGQILPELETAMINAKLGEADPNMVISRLGYHILYPVETGTRDGQKVWHIKHILVKTSGFDSWLNLMLKQFWVWHIK